MADFAFRVTPETLEKKASEFTSTIRDIEKRFDRILNVALKTRGYWRGEAGDKGREGFASYEDDIHAVTQSFEEQITNLLKMAGIYKQAEQKAEAKARELKVDQIV